MARNLFSIPIFFIVFRETLEAAIIISVLLGLAQQIVHGGSQSSSQTTTATPQEKDRDPEPAVAQVVPSEDDLNARRRLVRRLRIQIFLGAGLGFFIALAIGAAFIAVWFTKATDLWSKSEYLYEGSFDLVASIIIFFMGVTMLKMDRSKAKWRIKLERAFDGRGGDSGTKTGRWVLFILPFITVLREGLEAVVFVGGVSLGQPATSIPIAAIVGIICGLVCGFAIYQFASRTTLTIFLVVMTNLLLLIGSGLFTKAVSAFQTHAFNKLIGFDTDRLSSVGDGPGSYDVRGNVWHLDCCSPDTNGQGWSIFQAVLGWTNNATVGSVLAYAFYWLAVVVALVHMKFKEGRTTLFGRESAAGIRRNLNRQNAEASVSVDKKDDVPC